MAATVRLVLIRHGETEWNRIGRYQGQADPPLNEKGRVQAHALAQRLSNDGLTIDVMYSSPLLRAWETACILARALLVPLHPEPRLKEINLGVWQGILKQDIERQYPELFQKWETEPWSVQVPGGETLEDVQRRVYQAVDDMVPRHLGQTVALVAHHIVIALLKIRYQGLPKEDVRRISIPNAGYEVIEVKAPRLHEKPRPS